MRRRWYWTLAKCIAIPFVLLAGLVAAFCLARLFVLLMFWRRAEGIKKDACEYLKIPEAYVSYYRTMLTRYELSKAHGIVMVYEVNRRMRGTDINWIYVYPLAEGDDRNWDAFK